MGLPTDKLHLLELRVIFSGSCETFGKADASIDCQINAIRNIKLGQAPKLSKLIIHFVMWICLSVFLPLLPFGLGILIAILQQVELSIHELLDGIELLLISLALVTATGIDLSQSSIDWSARTLLYFFVRLALVLLGIGNLILLTLIYVDVRIANLSFDTGTKFALVGVLAVSISIVTVVLQLCLGYNRYMRSTEAATS